MVADTQRPLRVLYSFPHKLGASRICHTAWQQVNGVAAAGASVLAFPGVLHRAVRPDVSVRPTLARGRLRIPYKLLGRMRAMALHDYIVSRRLSRLGRCVDIIHVWPTAAVRTIRVAKRLGIPTVLERPNAHTAYAYSAVQRECERLNCVLPSTHEHAFHRDVLEREEIEYRLADKLLCPSEFVRTTFLDRGYPEEKLARHQYGFEEGTYFPAATTASRPSGLTFLFAGGCAPRKGLHFALEAWRKSAASSEGRFLIAGAFVPQYQQILAAELDHPRIQVLGHRSDLPDLMRRSDVLVLPTVEEGSALVTYEARACGCVLLVSEAAGAVARHGVNALIHSVADVDALAAHMTRLHEDRGLFNRLRDSSLQTAGELTWTAAGEQLLRVYRATTLAVGRPVHAS